LRGPTHPLPGRPNGSQEARAMSGIELYLMIAPLVVAALGLGVAWWVGH
jgi:hypothetical protein